MKERKIITSCDYSAASVDKIERGGGGGPHKKKRKVTNDKQKEKANLFSPPITLS